jgi:hydroxymethylglutaryl-CoA synthase
VSITPDPIGVGIDALGVYLPRYVLPLERLAVARDVPAAKITVGLGAHAMAVTPPWEDTVTLAVNAAAPLFARGDVRRDEIGLLVLGTETAVDHAKPASIFVHELLGLPASCRTFEVKHACYGGTAGVLLAADWVRSPASRGRKALVIASDIARYDLGSSAEFTQGAGAAAMVVSAAPRLLRLDPVTGVYANSVWDFWRPLDRREALVDGKFSLDCYLDALSGAIADWRGARNGDGSGPLLERFAAFLYHTPFPKMAHKAHARLVEGEGGDEASRAHAFERSYAERVDPWLALARQSGNTYTASLWLALAWMAEQQAAAFEERDVALFTYGSGSSAEIFSGRFPAGSAAVAAKIGARTLLDGRREVDVAEYEALLREGPRGGTPPAGYGAVCHLAAVRDHKREYHSEARAA